MNEIESVVYVIDADPDIRKALSKLLSSVNHKCECFESAQDFLNSQIYNQYSDLPSCLIMDVQMPNLNGLEFQQQLPKLNIQVSIIFVTGIVDIQMTVRAIKAGAFEFLTKPLNEQVLLNVIYHAIEYNCTVREQQAKVMKLQSQLQSLTPRERKVMEMVVTGKLNKQIAAELGIGERTIKAHRGQVMQKMEAGSLAELVLIAELLEIASFKQSVKPDDRLLFS